VRLPGEGLATRGPRSAPFASWFGSGKEKIARGREAALATVPRIQEAQSLLKGCFCRECEGLCQAIAELLDATLMFPDVGELRRYYCHARFGKAWDLIDSYLEECHDR